MRWLPSTGILLAVLAGLTGGLVAEPALGQESVTALTHVAVIPMDRERVLRDQTVLVQGDRIVALGPAHRVRVPAGAMQIDGRGKFLIPGLADMHAHAMMSAIGRVYPSDTLTADERQAAEDALFLYVANGVTTIRDMAGSPATLALRARAATGEFLSPRMYVATPMVFESEGVEAAARIPAAAKAAGYDLVKMYGLTGEALDSLVAEARRVGMPIAGHVPGNTSNPQGLEQALRAGYVSVEHLNGFIDNYEGGGLLHFGQAQVPVLAAAMRRAGAWSCPTLLVLAFNAGYYDARTKASWPELRYMSDTFVRRVRENAARSNQWPLGGLAGDMAKGKAYQAMATRFWLVKALRDAGVGLLLGTDDAAVGPPGFMVHRELKLLVEAGLTPYEALATGTRNVAAYFGTLDSTGTIAVGKRADLVLLTGNPLRDVRQTTHRVGVMLAGRWLPQAELEARLRTLEGRLAGVGR